ncbi:MULTISPECIES: hypothetical protein [unclassified Acidovorax]|uniref:hypothetical protein n=1 Tax=unclassified Acidovorax TaxID=2684926 RepID=UPI001124E0C7|nr:MULTISPECIES: hypothetical protein [unclassified Acidovorax]
MLFAIYLALDGYSHAHAPQVTLADDVSTLLRWFNASAGFLVLGLFSNVYYKAVLASEQRLRTIASTDPLTGALNRRAMRYEVDAAPPGLLDDAAARRHRFLQAHQRLLRGR